tara:strand:- start:262 stop:699 length:438 start_codon:yes stop_codon:yes gene_type:complete
VLSKVVSTQRQEYTDSDGKKKRREVLKKSYKTNRVKISTEMAYLLTYRIVNTLTGNIIRSGDIDAADSDKVDFINWNRYDGVNPSNLRIRDGSKFKRLSSDDRKAMGARSTHKTTDEMLKWGAGRIGREMPKEFLEALKHYSPTR